MKESVTYQAIIEKGIEQGERRGRLEEARRIVVRAGTRRFGTPSDSIVAALNAIPSPERLEDLVEKVFAVETWDELLREGN